MKKTLTTLAILLVSLISFSQTPPPLKNRGDALFTQADQFLAAVKSLSTPFGSTPTLNGGLPRSGSIFFNTTTSKLMVYDGSSWADIGSSTDISGKANLLGGNDFVGTQSVDGPIYATGEIVAGGGSFSVEIPDESQGTGSTIFFNLANETYSGALRQAKMSFFKSMGSGAYTATDIVPNPSQISNLRLQWPASSGTMALTTQIPAASSYVQNSTALQSSSNFNISGIGKMATLNLSTLPADKVGTTADILVRNATTGAVEKLVGDNSTYVRGNGIVAGFESGVRSTFLNGMVAGTNTPIVTSNSVIQAFANLQAQISALPPDANVIHTTGNETKTGRLTLTTPNGAAGTSPAAGLAPLAITGGNGGENTSTTGFALGASAANLTFRGGSGGASLISTGARFGGNGSLVELIGGDAGSGGTGGTSGNAGSAILQAGSIGLGSTNSGLAGRAYIKAGQNAMTGQKGGSIHLVPGFGNGGLAAGEYDLTYDGNTYLGINDNNSKRGATIIGTLTSDMTNIFQVTGNSKFYGNMSVGGNTDLKGAFKSTTYDPNSGDSIIVQFNTSEGEFQMVGKDIASNANLKVGGFITSSFVSAIGGMSAGSYRVTAMGTAPISSTAPGQEGDIVITANYIYICTSLANWKRIALTTW